MIEKYPKFACQHCGWTNYDVFYDWHYRKYKKEPSPSDYELLDAYIMLWRELFKLEMEFNNVSTKAKSR